jgi:hypothetical protein
MKAFVNLLIVDASAETDGEILDDVLANLEEAGIQVIWSKSKEADND